MDRLLAELSFDPVAHTDSNGNTTRDAHYLSQLNTLAIMNQSLSTLIRTNHLVKGKGGALLTTIEEALDEIRIELGI